MARQNQHERNIVDAALRLFRRNGYQATGINEILKQSGAPRGSLYYHFPDGKEAIAETALNIAGRAVLKSLNELAEKATTPGGFVRAYGDMLSHRMGLSGFREGCPITTTVLETTPQSTALTQAGRAAFDSWRELVENLLRRHGRTQDAARRQANLVLSAFEGAMILARVEQSSSPIRDCAQELARLLDR